MSTYDQTRARLATYFDQTAAETWERLTSDAPVSRIRQTVRAGRDRMREALLSTLLTDLRGARILDAGCGAGQMARELAGRGADVLADDISPALITVAERRTDARLAGRITWQAGDMLDPALGRFDYVIAMDSLIHYRTADIAGALDHLAARTDEHVAFTVAPKTPLLQAMWYAGQLFPRSDRSPAIQPQSPSRLAKAVPDLEIIERERINSGFYISQAMVAVP